MWILASSHLLLFAPQQPVRDTLRLYAVGDLNLGRTVTWRYLLAGDTLYPFAALRDTLRSADVLFGNLESPIAPADHTFERTGSWFSAPPLAADALAAAGFDVVSTANNHAWDAGARGVRETIRQLDRVGVAHAGTGDSLELARRPAIVERRGWRVAVFAATLTFNPAPEDFTTHRGAAHIAWADSTWLEPAIRQAKRSGAMDLIVVSVHGGREYTYQPDPGVRAICRNAIAAGADLCLGHHPHVLQSVEWVGGKPIVFSLGNFIFRQTSPWADLSAIFAFTISPDGGMTLRLLPVRADYQARLATGAEADSARRRVGVLSPPPSAAVSNP
jgi:poly-gamma-glutamate capsule biosynthesis protein CapA/YwtB (metallophosphatase superfamily)